ncbi:hypothetical protein Golax_024047 [Gossypium laxum]|uniref:Uncharacterized protein n=1 Tax=Gossypium laxum TaxID=34288 RepID=A0A7J8ZCA0_9ROSI|nr:hypothetical protein [Gossypium laxum]
MSRQNTSVSRQSNQYTPKFKISKCVVTLNPDVAASVKQPTFIKEFGTNLRTEDQESRRPEGANWETIRYEGKRCSSPLEQFKKQVCIRTWIHHNMKRCINGQKVKSNIPHIKWMIRWMQETGLVLQEFVRLNNMRVQKYSPELFGPIHSYYEAEKKGREEMEDNEDDKGEEEGDEIDFEEEDD